MKKRCFSLLVIASLFLSACNPEEPATEIVQITETEVIEQTEISQTEVETEGKDDSAGKRTVDFSALSLPVTVGPGDEHLIAASFDTEQGEITFFTITDETYEEVGKATLETPVDQISAIAESKGRFIFSTYQKETEHTTGQVQYYEYADGALTLLYQSMGDDLNRGQNLFFNGEDILVTENISELEGLYFVEIGMISGEGKRILNVEAFPKEEIDLILREDEVIYAANRDDHLTIVRLPFEGEEEAITLQGDSAAFRLTDEKDGAYLVDNYNGHPEQTNALTLFIENGEMAGAFAMEVDNVHSATFQDDQKIALANMAGEEKVVSLEDAFVVSITENSYTHEANTPWMDHMQSGEEILYYQKGHQGVIETMEYLQLKP